MLPDFDPFVVFRWTLATVCTIYATVVSLRSLWDWLVYFGSSRETKVMGRYAGVLLLRVRVKRFAGELFQITLLSAILCGLIYLHRYVV